MGKEFDRLRAGSPAFSVEVSGGGLVLVADPDHHDEFGELVRYLIHHDRKEFVVFPVTDGGTGYDRAIVLPI